MRSQLVNACLVFAGLSGPLTADAATITTFRDDIPSRIVSFRDLNLQTPEGVSRLYSRIELAAKRVCMLADPRFVDAYTSQRRCEERAIEHAVADVRSAPLSIFHMAMTNQLDAASNR